MSFIPPNTGSWETSSSNMPWLIIFASFPGGKGISLRQKQCAARHLGRWCRIFHRFFLPMNLRLHSPDCRLKLTARSRSEMSWLYLSYGYHTGDGSEIQRSPVDMENRSHYLQGFIYLRWLVLWDFWTIKSIIEHVKFFFFWMIPSNMLIDFIHIHSISFCHANSQPASGSHLFVKSSCWIRGAKDQGDDAGRHCAAFRAEECHRRSPKVQFCCKEMGR